MLQEFAQFCKEHPTHTIRYDDSFIRGHIRQTDDQLSIPLIDPRSVIEFHISYVDCDDIFNPNKLADTIHCPKVEVLSIYNADARCSIESHYHCDEHIDRVSSCTTHRDRTILKSFAASEADISNLKMAVHNTQYAKTIILKYKMLNLLSVFNMSQSSDMKNLYYEPLLFHVYSSLNQDSLFLDRLIKNANLVIGKWGQGKFQKKVNSLFAIDVSLSINAHIEKTVLGYKDWTLFSKNAMSLFTAGKHDLFATPRILIDTLPPQESSNYNVVWEACDLRKYFLERIDEVPETVRNIFSSDSHYVGYYCLHYSMEHRCLIPFAIHPELSMTFFNASFRKCH